MGRRVVTVVKVVSCEESAAEGAGRDWRGALSAPRTGYRPERNGASEGRRGDTEDTVRRERDDREETESRQR